MGASGTEIFSVLAETSPAPGPVVDTNFFWSATDALAANAAYDDVPGGEAHDVPWKVLNVPALDCICN